MSRHIPKIPRNREPCGLPSEQSSNSFWHSEPSALLTAHRSTRELPVKADVVIIGSGITGTSIAHHLLTEGSSQHNGHGNGSNTSNGPNVVMLEAREACWGATGRNGGHCQPLLFQHPHDPSIGNFELANFRALQELIDEKQIDCEFVAQSGVRAIYSKQQLTDVELALYTMKSTAPKLADMMHLTTSQADLDSYRIPTAVGAVVTSIAARMWPYKFVSHILESLLTSTTLNGTFNLQTLTPVTSLEPYYPGNRWTVKTSRGTITADHVVLATNGYTSHLLPSFADLIVPCRGQMSALEPLPSLTGDTRLHTSLGFMGEGVDDYLVQRPNERGGHLMFGGGRSNGLSMGLTDDSGFDEKTASYLRSRLVEALGLPEGRTEKEKKTRTDTRSVRSSGAVAILCDKCGEAQYTCEQRSTQNPCTTCVRFGRHPPTSAAGASNATTAKKKAEFTASHQWTGIMGFSRDELPWIGPVPEQPGLFVAAGFTGHGMPNTWLCGKAVAQMVQKSMADAPVEARAWTMADLMVSRDITNGLPRVEFERVKAQREAVDEEQRMRNAAAARAKTNAGIDGKKYSGCHTCRHRKKVCDGPKPFCGNCERGGFDCAGFEAMPPLLLRGAALLGAGNGPVGGSDKDEAEVEVKPAASTSSDVDDVVALPRSYLVTKERIAKAMELEDVEAKDWAEMDRVRRRKAADRIPSGYA